MNSAAAAYLFLLGLASGFALLAASAYRRVSPAWLKWLLLSTTLLVLGRYLTLALFTQPDAPRHAWAWRHLWFGTSLGLTLPSVMAIDQLLRHPAMSPKTLLRWCSPFFATYAAVMLFGDMHPAPDRIVGWTLQLSAGWRLAVSIAQSLFVLTFLGGCAVVARKVPVPRIRIALAFLALGHVTLAVDGVILAAGGWYVRPFLYSEMLTLAALWHAYETSAALQQSA